MDKSLARIYKFLVFTFLGLFLVGCATTTNFSQQSDVQDFIHYMVVKYNFDENALNQLFCQFKPNFSLIHAMETPRESTHKTPWYVYRRIFLSGNRAEQGADYWCQHPAMFVRAQQMYGVPPQIILAILGVETRYGRILGKDNVFDTIATLAFYYPQREHFFRNELVQLLLLCRETPLNPLTLNGSYAGAFGQGQFMPSSYRQYSVDSDGKGYSDLISNDNDAILSVGNYFKAKGWIAGEPVAVPARIVGTRYLDLPDQTKPTMTLAELSHYGIYSSVKLPMNEQAYLVVLQGENGPEYWLAFHNFNVIKRYNASTYYAMAVYQLSNAIVKEHNLMLHH